TDKDGNQLPEWKKPSDLPGYSLATFVGDRRNKESVEAVYGVSLDYEGGTTIDEARESWRSKGYTVILNTSFNHRPEGHRFRLTFCLPEPVSGSEAEIVWQFLAAEALVAGHVIDESPKDSSRFWFAAAAPEGAEYLCEVWEGSDLDVETILHQALQPIGGDRA